MEGPNEIDWFGGRCLVSWEMGLGKTMMCLLWMLLHPECLPAIVVCPASAKWVWQEEAWRWNRWGSVVLDGRTPRRYYGDSPPDLVIINYDVLGGWVKTLRASSPRTIVFDECQMLMSSASKRTRASRRLARGVDCVLALSGTPLLNRPIELFPILNILDPERFPSRFEFAETWCDPRWTPWGVKYLGSSNPRGLNRLLLRSCMSRRRKADVLKDLPPKQRFVVPLPLDDHLEYDKARDDFLRWLEGIDSTRAESAAKAEGLTRVGYLLRLAARLKLSSVLEWISSWMDGNEGKLVVFAEHKEIIDALSRGSPARSVRIDGGTSIGERERAVHLFQTDPTVRMLIGSRSASVAITLAPAASDVAFAEMWWRPGDHLQAEDRCHRIGARQTVRCWYLVARGTIEERLCRIVQDKQRDVSATLDGHGRGERLDVWSALVAGEGGRRRRTRMASSRRR